MTRSPNQVIFTFGCVIIGLLLGARLLQWVMDQRRQQVPPIDREFRDLKPEELADRLGGAGRPLPPRAPTTWREISLREYTAPASGEMLRLLRCRIEASEVEKANPGILAVSAETRSTCDGMPPAWWPWERDQAGSPWRVCAWWQPSGRQACHRLLDKGDGILVGEYLDYDPATGWMHLWEWWRRGVQAPPPPARPTVDVLARGLSRHLLDQGQGADREGWLIATAVTGLPADWLPPGLRQVDCAILPLARRSVFLLALRGISWADVCTVAEVDSAQELPAEAAPPVLRWQAFLPELQGRRALPSWFAPGPGPRRLALVVAPGSGRIGRARWIAWDQAGGGICFVWEWRDQERQPAGMDPRAGAG